MSIKPEHSKEGKETKEAIMVMADEWSKKTPTMVIE